MEQDNMNEKVKQALKCLWIAYASLGVVGGKKGLMEEKKGYFFESGYNATSCSYTQSFDLSGLGSILWSCRLHFLHCT